MLLPQLLLQHPEAIADIVRSTPRWVAVLLGFLIYLGLSASRTRRLPALQLAAVPLAMTALALWGVLSAFGDSDRLLIWLAVWLVGYALALAATWSQRAPEGTRYDAASRRFELPGSWVPMALILAVFLMKYGVGVQLAMEPTLAQHTGFAFTITAIYGALSGIFATRTLRVLRLGHSAKEPAMSPAL